MADEVLTGRVQIRTDTVNSEREHVFMIGVVVVAVVEVVESGFVHARFDLFGSPVLHSMGLYGTVRDCTVVLHRLDGKGGPHIRQPSQGSRRRIDFKKLSKKIVRYPLRR